MPGRWIWQRSAAKPAPVSTIEIRLSEAAKEYLIDIWISMQARWGGAQADSYLDDLDRALRLLADNPQGTDYTHILPGTFDCRATRRVCRMKDNHISILRVLHQSMDVIARLKNI